MPHISKASFIEATAGVTWRLTAPMTELVYLCDLPGCDAEATTFHFLPWVGLTCEKVLFACDAHDAGGYWCDIKGFWTDGPPDMNRPGERYTTARHIEKKIGGEQAINLLWDRIHAMQAIEPVEVSA